MVAEWQQETRRAKAAPNWKHQAREYLIGRDKRSRALIWPMRSGKSKTCIDKACYHLNHGRIAGVIVIAPNGVHLNWAVNEIPKWAWEEIGPHDVFAWETPKRGLVEQDMRFQALCEHKGPKWLTVNMEALKHLDCRRAIRQFMRSCRGQFMLIVSEAHHFGHAGSKRTFFARSLAYHANYVQTETGTPILTGPLRAYSQYELLAPGALGFKRFAEFKEHYAEVEKVTRGGRTYEKIVKYNDLDGLRNNIAKWSSVVLRNEVDLPPLIRTERPVIMSDRCRTTYLEMVSHHLAEIGEDYIAAKDAGPRMMKLQQILHGYVMDTEARKLIEIDPDATIYDALYEQIVGGLPGKTLVWCRYKADIRRIIRKLPGNLGIVQYHGDIPVNEREKNRIEFNTNDKKGVCLGTPDTGGEGLDFSGADTVIFFSIPPNGRMIAQAEERATQVGGKNISVVRMRHYGTVDDRLWQIVDGNATLADSITGQGLRDLLLQTDC